MKYSIIDKISLWFMFVLLSVATVGILPFVLFADWVINDKNNFPWRKK